MKNKSLPSHEMVDGAARAPARAMLRAAGYDDEALAKPMIALVNTWSTRDAVQHASARPGRPCRDAASRRPAAPPIDFNTIVVTDGISMGTPRHARLADEPRGHRRFRRAGGARPFARRRPVPGRLRQDHPGRGDGGGPARSAERHPLRRLDHARPSRRQGDHHPGRVRGGRRAQRRHDRRCRAEGGREAPPAPAPAPAAASSPPTRWRWR